MEIKPRKIKSLDDIWWKSVNVAPLDIRKILDGRKTNFIVRERYGKKYNKNKRMFWKNDYVFVREQWHPDFFSKGRFLYEADSTYPYVNWNPPQQMPRQAARIFLRIIKIERKRIQEVRSNEIRNFGCDFKQQFIDQWDIRYWRTGDKWESNPIVGIYKFRKININTYNGGPVIKPRYEEE